MKFSKKELYSAAVDEKYKNPRDNHKSSFIMSMLNTMPFMPTTPSPDPKEPGSYNPHNITRAEFKHKKKRRKAAKISRRANR